MRKSLITIVLVALVMLSASFATTHSKIKTHKPLTKIEKVVSASATTEVKKPAKKQNWLVRKAKSAKWRVTHMFKKHKK
jgi:uncharacterized protein YxeA